MRKSLLNTVLTTKQRRLKKKHGDPAEFARAVYAAVPGDISMNEARVAIQEYNREWLEAGYLSSGCPRPRKQAAGSRRIRR